MAGDIIIKGLDELNGKIQKYGNGMKSTLQSATKNAVTYVWSQIPPEDSVPPPPGSTYRRTNTLVRTMTSWQGSNPSALSRVQDMFSEIVGVVGTMLNYAHWVVDKEDQAWMHKGRWYILQDVVMNARPGIIKVYQNAVHDFTRKIFP